MTHLKLVLLLALSAFSVDISAARIRVKPGHGDKSPICQNIAKRGNSLPSSCIDSAIYSSPELIPLNGRALDPLEHVDLLTKLRHYRSAPMAYSKHPLSVAQIIKERSFTIEEIRNRQITLSSWQTDPIAYFDRDQKKITDGKIETLVRVEYNDNPSQCTANSTVAPNQSMIFFVNPELTDVDSNVDPAAASLFEVMRLFRVEKYLVLVDATSVMPLPASSDPDAPSCEFEKH